MTGQLDWVELFFSSAGRLARGPFWLAAIVLLVLLTLYEAITGPTLRLLTVVGLIVLPGVKADRCDPVHDNLLVTKVGMVAATRPGDGAGNSASEFALSPREVLTRVRASLDEY